MILYKIEKTIFGKMAGLPDEVKRWLEHEKDYSSDGTIYVESEDYLKDRFGENEQEWFEFVKEWFEENNLYETYLSIEE